MRLYNSVGLIVATLLLAACNNGGQLTLESGARKVITKGNPYVTVNNGGKALVRGHNGVTGWVTIQSVAAGNLSNPSTGHQMIMNKPSARR